MSFAEEIRAKRDILAEFVRQTGDKARIARDTDVSLLASSPEGLAEATLLGLRHRPSGMAGGATALYKAVLYFALTRMRKEPWANLPGLFYSPEALFTTLGFGNKSVKTRPSSFPHAGQMISSHSRFSSTTDLPSHPIVLLHLSQTPTVSYKPPSPLAPSTNQVSNATVARPLHHCQTVLLSHQSQPNQDSSSHKRHSQSFLSSQRRKQLFDSV